MSMSLILYTSVPQNSLANASYDAFIKEDLDSLPPNQRRKRIQHRMDDLAAKISQETSTRCVASCYLSLNAIWNSAVRCNCSSVSNVG